LSRYDALPKSEYEAKSPSVARRSLGRFWCERGVSDVEHGVPPKGTQREQAVKSIAKMTKEIIVIALTALVGPVPALAGTFVYVSNAEDGDIGVYSAVSSPFSVSSLHSIQCAD
jgi:hypothetical protein